MVGTYILAMALSVPFQLIGSQLKSIQATDINYEFSLNNYLILGLAGALLPILGATAIAVILKYQVEVILIILIIAATKAIENVSGVFQGIMQQHERMDLLACSLAIKGVLSVTAFGLLLYTSQNLLLPVLGLTGVSVLVLFTYDLPRGCNLGRQRGLKRGSGVVLKDMVSLTKKTAPLSITALLISLNTNIPRFGLERFWGLKTLGFFGPVAYVLAFGDLAAAAVGRATAPRMARYWLLDRKALRPLVLKLLALLIVLSLGSIILAFAFGSRVLSLLFGPAYAPYASLLLWLTAAMGFGIFSQFFSYLLTAMRLLNCQAILSLITVALTVVLCYILIPSFGLLGTAWVICLVQLVRFAASYFIYLKAFSQTSP